MRRLFLLLPLLAGCQEPGRVAQADADLQAVRAWLRENTDSGEWEEVRWWPAVSIDRPDFEQFIRDRNPNAEADELKVAAHYFGTLRNAGITRICRLKFRTHNESGALELRDQVFVFRNGRVEPRIDASYLEYVLDE